MISPLLREEERRYNLFPIRYDEIWKAYNDSLACFWVAGEIDLSGDKADFDSLSEQERHFLSMVLAFFATSDGIVADNLSERFGREICIREAKMFYDLQKTMENIHSTMYSLLIDTYISDPSDKQKLFHSIENFPCVEKKAKWALTWMESSLPFQQRLIAFAVVEGIFFSGSFCSIFWLKSRGKMPGLCSSNTLIARDEGMHQDFAVLLYNSFFDTKVEQSRVKQIVREAVDVEKEFITEAIPASLIGINNDTMKTYIEFVADRLLTQLGYEKEYNSECPFDFMLTQGMQTKTNFFEHRSTEYQKSGVNVETNKFSTDEEF
jgi:ribonucleoside-diphosphate reductase beta chain